MRQAPNWSDSNGSGRLWPRTVAAVTKDTEDSWVSTIMGTPDRAPWRVRTSWWPWEPNVTCVATHSRHASTPPRGHQASSTGRQQQHLTPRPCITGKYWQALTLVPCRIFRTRLAERRRAVASSSKESFEALAASMVSSTCVGTMATVGARVVGWIPWSPEALACHGPRVDGGHR